MNQKLQARWKDAMLGQIESRTSPLEAICYHEMSQTTRFQPRVAVAGCEATEIQTAARLTLGLAVCEVHGTSERHARVHVRVLAKLTEVKCRVEAKVKCRNLAIQLYRCLVLRAACMSP